VNLRDCCLCRQDFDPKIHLTDLDFMSLTDNLKLCDEDGQLGLKEFEVVMRRQMRQLVQSKLVLTTLDRAAEESDFMIHGPLKVLLMEQALADQRMARMAQDVQMIMRRLCLEEACGSPVPWSPFRGMPTSPLRGMIGSPLRGPGRPGSKPLIGDVVPDLPFLDRFRRNGNPPSPPASAIGFASQKPLPKEAQVRSPISKAGRQSVSFVDGISCSSNNLQAASAAGCFRVSSKPPAIAVEAESGGVAEPGLVLPRLDTQAEPEASCIQPPSPNDVENEHLLLHEVRRMALAVQDLARKVLWLGAMRGELREVKAALMSRAAQGESAGAADCASPQNQLPANGPLLTAGRRPHRAEGQRPALKRVGSKGPPVGADKVEDGDRMVVQSSASNDSPSKDSPEASARKAVLQIAPSEPEPTDAANFGRASSDRVRPTSMDNPAPDPRPPVGQRQRTGSILRHTRIGDPEPTEPAEDSSSLVPARAPRIRTTRTADPTFWLRNAPAALDRHPSAASGAGGDRPGWGGWSGPSVVRKLTAACSAALPRLRSSLGGSEVQSPGKAGGAKAHEDPAAASRAGGGAGEEGEPGPTSARFVFEPRSSSPAGGAGRARSEAGTGGHPPARGHGGSASAEQVRAARMRSAWRAAQGLSEQADRRGSA